MFLNISLIIPIQVNFFLLINCILYCMALWIGCYVLNHMFTSLISCLTEQHIVSLRNAFHFSLFQTAQLNPDAALSPCS